MNEILWRPKALRQLRKIKNLKDQATLFDAVETLKQFPDCANVKKLAGRDDFRLRVGRWRVIFTATLEIVCIEEVRKRDEHTY